MPEGDTVYVHAQSLRPLLVGASIVAAASRWPGRVVGLAGHTVHAVEPIGKHLLLEVDDGTTLRIHLGMKGRWRALGAGAEPRISPGQVSLRLDTAAHVLLCTRAPTLERFRTRERRVHPVLAHLGPDLLGSGFDAEVAAARARTRTDPAWPTVGEVLLDQQVACGIGNVYKSEVLFLQRLDPFTPPEAIPEELWQALYTRAEVLMRRNLTPLPRNTTGLGRGRPALWVYGRAGRACLRCGTPVSSRTHGRDLPRVTYWCARCQNAPDP